MLIWLKKKILNLPKQIVKAVKAKDFLPILAISVVFWGILISNFPYKAWFSGWDNLHPEFNFWLNLKRSFSVWYEEGLGIYGGHGYQATLLHTLVLGFLDIFLPKFLLRSAFTFLMLFTGGVGTYFVFKKISQKLELNNYRFIGFLVSFYYLVNIGTVQNFYIQLEAFIVHFAFLPLIVLTLMNFLEKKNKKNLYKFGIVSFLSSVQGFIPPLFIVSSIYVGIMPLVYWFFHRSWDNFRKILTIIFVWVGVNAYWLLPVAYYAISNNSSIYLNSYNNQLSTADFIYRNKEYGGLKDVALIRGFLFEAQDTATTGEAFYFMQPWISHFQKLPVLISAYVVFGIILLGAWRVFGRAKKEKNWLCLALLILFLLSFTALATDFFPFSIFSYILQNYIPIFKQAFRAAFTKFSISLAFCYAIFWGIGISSLVARLRKKIVKKIVLIGFSLIVFYLGLPSFKGQFIYNRMKIRIPEAYFNLFDFFKNQDKNTRIANLPQGWNWGWSVYNWNYSGSGFLWYGIEQPILDRAFDVWGIANENYFWELHQAIFSDNEELFTKVMEKYQVNWVIFDPNIMAYPNIKEDIYTNKVKEILDKNIKFELVKAFGGQENGVREIYVYRVKLDNKSQDFVSLSNGLVNIGPEYYRDNMDNAYLEFGDYMTDQESKYGYYYPFRSLFNNISENENFEIGENNNNFIIKNEIDTSNFNNFIAPTINYKSYIEDGKIAVEIPKVDLLYSSANDNNFNEPKQDSCSKNGLLFEKEIIFNNNEKTLRFKSEDSHNCFVVDLDGLWQKYGYIIKITAKNVKGMPLRVSIINKQSKKTDFEEILKTSKEWGENYLLIGPNEYDGKGYVLSIDNISYGDNKTINDLKSVEVYKFPYEEIKGIKFSSINNIKNNEDNFFVKNSFKKVFSWFYKAEFFDQAEVKDLVLSQSYSDGWLAFSQNEEGKWEKLTHVKVNNWANGWKLNKNQELRIMNQGKEEVIYIIFWPQILEFIGFGMLVGIFAWIFIKKNKEERNVQ